MKLKNHLYVYLIFSSLLCTVKCTSSNASNLLILDTEGQHSYFYRNMILTARSVGFKVEYRSLYGFLENNNISTYDAVFLLVSPQFIKNLKHPIIQSLLTKCKQFSQLPDKTLGILLPTIGNFNSNYASILIALLEHFNVVTAQEIKSILQNFLPHLLKPDLDLGSFCGTTLVNRKTNNAQYFSLMQNMQDQLPTDIQFLPTNTQCLSTLNYIFPAGVLIKNNQNKSNFFISALSHFVFADIAENFWRCPINQKYRISFLKVMQQMLFDLYRSQNGSTFSLPDCPPLPHALTLKFIKEEKHKNSIQNVTNNPAYSWIIDQGIKAAWLDPNDYFLIDDGKKLDEVAKKHPEEKQTLLINSLKDGINFLYNADMNLLWFEFNPETFFSPSARYKDTKNDFIEKVTKIATTIKDTYKKAGKELPKIFVGTDITTNFGIKKVPCFAQDVFGNSYSKIPCPLDYDCLWKPEVVDVFRTFYTTFNTILPVSGIFLDFEMYHAQDQASAYTNLMDFSANAWQNYQKTNNTVPSCATVHERVNYLIKNKAFKDYFKALKSSACTIGFKIKEELKKLDSNLLIGAYCPTLPHSWFYVGILQGLSSKHAPVIFTSFNTDYYSHRQWLEHNKVYLIHGVPILLSKFQKLKDFDLIPYLAQFHDFIWFNKPSRMVYENKNNRWWSNEASPLSAQQVAQGIKEAYED